MAKTATFELSFFFLRMKNKRKTKERIVILENWRPYKSLRCKEALPPFVIVIDYLCNCHLLE